jgi:hypothetical protein
MDAEFFRPEDELGRLLLADELAAVSDPRAALVLRSAVAYSTGVQLHLEAIVGPAEQAPSDWVSQLDGTDPDGIKAGFWFEERTTPVPVLTHSLATKPAWTTEGAGGGGRIHSWASWVSPLSPDGLLHLTLSWMRYGILPTERELPLQPGGGPLEFVSVWGRSG